ncbi:bifunctional protein GlmU [Clostridia bacterium]|nr:bifunctional protein GlmU [Clostridia bacterium]
MKNCVILAAGDGRRMKSSLPKPLHDVAFKPMLGWVLDTATQVCGKIALVISDDKTPGSGGQLVREYCEQNYRGTEITYFVQNERRGTGHAVIQAGELINATAEYEIIGLHGVEIGGDILVLCGDAPFVDAATINEAYESHKNGRFDITVISAYVEEPTGYGRIIRGKQGIQIKEERDCDGAEREITEVNSGVYWFRAGALKEVLPRIKPENAAGEYYLTDTLEAASHIGFTVQAFRSMNRHFCLGANFRRDLRELSKIAYNNEINRVLDSGVDVIGENVLIGPDVCIGMDTKILPNTIICGSTVIGEDCVIGPNCVIKSCAIGSGVVLDNVKATDAVVEDGAKVGPFAQLRPGTRIRKNVKIGNFVEIKNSDVGAKTSVAHLTYIGDSDVGGGCNFGCGCVTANYDGVRKFRTTIGDDCFIGCNTNFIAPVTVGDRATTAAGSTIYRDVPPESLAIERGEQVNKPGWVIKEIKKSDSGAQNFGKSI